jgi:tetratricopeptide (TPR) repeat protein
MLTRISPPARVVLGVTLSLALVLARGSARADGGGGGGSPSMPSSPSNTFDTSQQQTPEEKAAQDKQHAQEMYDQAYREVDKAKAEMQEASDLRAQATANGANNTSLAKKADDKDASARKRLEKSRDKFNDVTTLDPSHADGWNMLGYTRRKTGDVDGAFQAYWKCLALKPEHLGAHEYLGEADLEKGKLADARAELAWLQKKGDAAKENAAHLDAAIHAWVAANPAAATPATQAAATPSTTPATADTTATAAH